MTEAESWASLRSNLVLVAASFGGSIHIVRVESMVGSGIFDTNLCFKGHELWIEGKHLPSLPKRKTTLIKVGMSSDQEAFALRRLMAGGLSFLWCRVGKGPKRTDGFGWYLFKLESNDIISKVRNGMCLKEFLQYRHVSSTALASCLLSYRSS